MFAFTARQRGLNVHGCAGGHHHQHAAVGANGFKVKVDAHHRIGTHGLRFYFQLLQGIHPRFFNHSFVCSASAANNIADAGKNVFYNVGTNNGFRGNNAKVLLNGPSFDGGCGGQ